MGLDEVLERTPSLFEDFALHFEEVRFAIDPDSLRLLYIDPVYERLWGGSLENAYEDLWAAWAERVHPEDRDAVPSEAQRILDGYDHTFRVPRAEEDLRWVRVRVLPLRDQLGKVEVLLGTMRDVTATRRREEELSRARNSLAEAQWLAGVGSWGWDIPENRVELSDHLYHMLGSEPGGFSPSLREILRRVHPDDRDVAIQSLKDAADSGKPLRAEYRMRRDDGTTWWVQAAGRLVRGPGGEPLRLEGIALDITERKRLEEELREVRRTAEGAEQAKSRFLANLSHEIRTPLSGIIQMARTLAEHQLSVAQRERAGAIEHAGASLLEMVNEFLDWARIEAGRAELQHHEFNPEEILWDLAHLFQPVAREKGVGFSIQVSPRLPVRIRGHREALRRVLSNLVGNAVKFTSDGYVSVTVGVPSSDQERARLRVDVRDTGIGIGRGDQERIFDQFAQANASISRRFGGTGLGLAISRELAELMGGFIRLKSELGQGSTFSFELEVELAGAGDEEALGPPPALLGRRALVVSEAPATREAISEALQRWDPTIGTVAASSGKEALTLVEEAWKTGHPIPLAIVDPGVGKGEEPACRLAEDLRGHPGGSDLCLVLLRPEVELFEIARPARAGFRATVPNPRYSTDFLGTLTSGVNRKERMGPIPRAVESRSPSDPAPPNRRRSGTRLSGRVLLAEDSWVNKEALSHALEEMGCRVDAVSTGTEAVRAFRGGTYDILFVDIQMPGLDGFELAERIREEEKSREGDPVPIVGLTGHAHAGIAEEARAAGMDECLFKPLDSSALRGIVDRFLPETPEADPPTLS